MTTDERRKLREDCRLVARVIRMDGHPRLAAMVRDLANDHEAMEQENRRMRGEPSNPGGILDAFKALAEASGGRFDGMSEADVIAYCDELRHGPAAPRTEGE